METFAAGDARSADAGLARLAAWVGGRTKEYEAVAQKRDADAPAADRALELVRRFIVERGLVLYGGQAIDYALRLKGSRIYPDFQTPDFDCFSPRSVDDAYDLAEALRDAGFANVGALPAIHVQTMRVTTDFIFVADLSYAPPAVFETLPTISYAGMKVLHPDYQRADIHLAFCFPLNNPPREDIFHRFRKDLKRFNLLEEFYPVTSGAALAKRGGGHGAAPRVDLELDLSRVAVHGFAAYGLLRACLDELLGAARGAGVDVDDLAVRRESLPEIAVAAAPGASPELTRLEFTPPAEVPRLVVATPWPEDVVAAVAARRDAPRVERYAPYMDSRPPVATVSGGADPPVDVYSTANRLLAVTVVRPPGPADREAPRVTVASAQYLLLYFLYEAHVAREPENRDLFVRFYRATLELLAVAGDAIERLRTQDGGPEVPAEVYRRFVEGSPFGLTVQTLGDVNHDASYLIRVAGSARAVGDTPPPATGIDPAALPDLADVPARYYPRGAKEGHDKGRPPPFDYAANPAFQRAGQPRPG